MNVYKRAEPIVKIIGCILFAIFICFVIIYFSYTTFFALIANITSKPIKYNFLGSKYIFVPYDCGYDNPGEHQIH